MVVALPFMLMSLPTLAAGQVVHWLEVDRLDDGIRIFADLASLTRVDDTAELRHLVRWGEPQIDPDVPAYLSTTVQSHYHCTEKLEKYLASTSYTGAMGDGQAVLVDTRAASTWTSISADSMEEKLWKIACEIP